MQQSDATKDNERMALRFEAQLLAACQERCMMPLHLITTPLKIGFINEIVTFSHPELDGHPLTRNMLPMLVAHTRPINDEVTSKLLAGVRVIARMTGTQ